MSFFFPKSYFLGEGKRGVFPFSPLFSPFSLYRDLTSMFSQENISKKTMSFFSNTKCGKISTQKKIVLKL
jgi:hypothetical protein